MSPRESRYCAMLIAVLRKYHPKGVELTAAEIDEAYNYVVAAEVGNDNVGYFAPMHLSNVMRPIAVAALTDDEWNEIAELPFELIPFTVSH
jgi:hypothetical protein